MAMEIGVALLPTSLKEDKVEGAVVGGEQGYMSHHRCR